PFPHFSPALGRASSLKSRSAGSFHREILAYRSRENLGSPFRGSAARARAYSRHISLYVMVRPTRPPNGQDALGAASYTSELHPRVDREILSLDWFKGL